MNVSIRKVTNGYIVQINGVPAAAAPSGTSTDPNAVNGEFVFAAWADVLAKLAAVGFGG